MSNLLDKDQDYAYSQGFLDEWLKDAPLQVKEHLKILVDGIDAYRDNYTTIQEKLDTLQEQHNQLLIASAQYLHLNQQLQRQLDESLAREQKSYRDEITYENVPGSDMYGA
jgi:hypothetical protein